LQSEEVLARQEGKQGRGLSAKGRAGEETQMERRAGMWQRVCLARQENLLGTDPQILHTVKHSFKLKRIRPRCQVTRSSQPCSSE
jgi:hypothetical protein